MAKTKDVKGIMRKKGVTRLTTTKAKAMTKSTDETTIVEATPVPDRYRLSCKTV